MDKVKDIVTVHEDLGGFAVALASIERGLRESQAVLKALADEAIANQPDDSPWTTVRAEALVAGQEVLYEGEWLQLESTAGGELVDDGEVTLATFGGVIVTIPGWVPFVARDVRQVRAVRLREGDRVVRALHLGVAEELEDRGLLLVASIGPQAVNGFVAVRFRDVETGWLGTQWHMAVNEMVTVLLPRPEARPVDEPGANCLQTRADLAAEYQGAFG